jgi:hypothetical protein
MRNCSIIANKVFVFVLLLNAGMRKKRKDMLPSHFKHVVEDYLNRIVE